MSGRKLNEKIVSIPEVKKIMEDVKQRIVEIDEEGMSHFQEITYSYVNKFSKMSDKAAMKIKKFLMEKYELEEIFANNIVNIDPQTLQEIRIILEKSNIGKNLTDQQLQEIISQIRDFKAS
jgi:DNA-directed RNA polymerase subunit F